MQIIVTHDNADFDALASQIAASKLYPEARVVLSQRLSRPVRDFLALHKDRFEAARVGDVDASQVTRVVVVDVRQGKRLSGLEAVVARVRAGDVSLEVHIYDHHAASDDDLRGALEVIEPVGAATTLLIEQLRARGVGVDPVEATLMALGIYADTGALTYAATTARDADAVAWLLNQGASLKMVNRYLASAFSQEQREVLGQMLGAVEVCEVGGVGLGFTHVELERDVPGLSQVTSQVLELEGHAALFALFTIGGKRVQVIARSRVPYIDVNLALSSIGGGGHPAAAAAAVKKGDAAALRERLLSALEADPPRPRAVRDLMSSPVRSASPDVTLGEIKACLETWRHAGMPVVRDGALVGIISRRDVEAAARGERLHLPVSSCMAHEVKTISPDASLEDALAAMVKADIGRLPVVEGGRMIGIISRSDLLRVLY